MGERGESAGAGRQGELEILAEVGWEEVMPLLDSPHWRSRRGGGLRLRAKGRREVEPERGGGAGAAVQGGRNHLRHRENPGPPQPWTGAHVGGSVM